MSGHDASDDFVSSDAKQEFKSFCGSVAGTRSKVNDFRRRVVKLENRRCLYNTAMKPKTEWTTFFALSSIDKLWRPMTQKFGPYRSSNLFEEKRFEDAEESHVCILRLDKNDPVDEIVRRVEMEALPSVGLLSLKLSKSSLTYNSSTFSLKCVPQESFGRELREVKKTMLDLEKKLQSSSTFEWIEQRLLLKLVDDASFKSEVAKNETYALSLEMIDLVLKRVELQMRGRRRPRDHDYLGADGAVLAKRQRVSDQESNGDSAMVYLHVANVPGRLLNVKYFASHFASQLVTFECNEDTLSVGFVRNEKALQECREFVKEPFSVPWLGKFVQAQVTHRKDYIFENNEKHSEGFNELVNCLLGLESEYDDIEESDGDDSECEGGDPQEAMKTLVKDLLDFEIQSPYESLKRFQLLTEIVIPFWKRITFNYQAKRLYDELKVAWHKFLLVTTFQKLLDENVLEASVVKVFGSTKEFSKSLHGWQDPTIVHVMSSEEIMICTEVQCNSELNTLRVQVLEKARDLNSALRLARFYGLEGDHLRLLLKLGLHEEAFARFFRDKKATESDRIQFSTQIVLDNVLDIVTRFRFLMHSAFPLLRRGRYNVGEGQLRPEDCFLTLLAEALAADSRCLPWIFSNIDVFGHKIVEALQHPSREKCMELFKSRSSSPESVLASTCLLIVDSKTTNDENILEVCDRAVSVKPLVAALVLVIRLRATTKENKIELQSRLWQVIMARLGTSFESDFSAVVGEALRLFPSECSVQCQLLENVILPEISRLDDQIQVQLKMAAVSHLVRRFRSEGFSDALHKTVIDCMNALENIIPQATKLYSATLLGVLAESYTEIPRELLQKVCSEPSLREETSQMLLANIKLSLCLDHVDFFLEHCREVHVSDLLEYCEACPQDAINTLETMLNAGAITRYPGLKARFIASWNGIFGSSSVHWARLLSLAMVHFTDDNMPSLVLRGKVCEALKSSECRGQDKVLLLKLLHANADKISFAKEVCASGAEFLARESPELFLTSLMEWADEDLVTILANVVAEKVYFAEGGLDIDVLKCFFESCAEKFPSVLNSQTGLLLSLFKKDVLLYCDLLLNHGPAAEIDDACRHLLNIVAKGPRDVIEKVMQKLIQSGKVEESRLLTLTTEYVDTTPSPNAALVISIVDWLKDGPAARIPVFLGNMLTRMTENGTSLSCHKFVRPVCTFLRGLCESQGNLKLTIANFFGGVIRLVTSLLTSASSSVSVATWKRDVSGLTRCVLRCKGCQGLIAFLENPHKITENITGNGDCRKCISRILNTSWVDRSTGRQVRAFERLSVTYREVTAKENGSNCGAMSVTKKEVPDAAKAALIREYQSTILMLSSLRGELATASGNLSLLN